MTLPDRPKTTRRTWCLALALAACAAFPASALATPTAGFSIGPASPNSLDVVTFTSSSSPSAGEAISQETWDFNGDGTPDANGKVVSTTFFTPGPRKVTLKVTDTGPANNVDTATNTVVVDNLPPIADFIAFGGSPLNATKAAVGASASQAIAGEKVSLVSTAYDPDGTVVAYRWDLDGDGEFDDSIASTTSTSFATTGKHKIGLYVRDRLGAAASVNKTINVVAPPATLMSPFPRTRIAGRSTSGGTRITLLFLRAPRGSSVSIRCAPARTCPFRKALKRKIGKTGSLRVRQLEHTLRTGTLIRVNITQKNRIGSYTSFRMRAGASPLRVDRCLYPGSSKPKLCPDQ